MKLVAALFLSSLFFSAAVAQQVEGMLDVEADVRDQIDLLEKRLKHGSDQPASEQVVWLQWLIELYDFVGDEDGVDRCYQQILAYYPYDVGTMNAYALFLMERREDYEQAERRVRDAAEWGKNTDARALDLGTSFQLLARAELARGATDSSIVHAKVALSMLDEEASTSALRVLAESYLQAGAFDDAAEAYMKLIALDRALNREDVNALKLFLHKTSRYNTGSITGLIEKRVEESKSAQRARIESEGGKVVTLRSVDGVVLEGTLRPAPGAGAVLFVPDLGRGRDVYTPYEQLLFVEGISTLSLDLRGHGGSRSDSLYSYGGLSREHADRLVDDVVTGFHFLRQQTGLADSLIMIVSAGRGCAVVEKALHDGSLSAPVAYFSPVFGAADLQLKNAVYFHPDLPLLVVFSVEDLKAAQSYELFRGLKDFSRLNARMLEDSGHGVEILRRNTGALEFFQAWARKTLGIR